MEKSDANPMHKAHEASRCTATAKRTGLPCRAPAVRGWCVCRMHGAGGGAQEMVEARKMVSALIRMSRETMGEV
jgi:hypothetical protein